MIPELRRPIDPKKYYRPQIQTGMLTIPMVEK